MLKRDFGILLLSVCALYLSLQHEGAFQFRKAWWVPNPPAHPLWLHLPPPPALPGTAPSLKLRCWRLSLYRSHC